MFKVKVKNTKMVSLTSVMSFWTSGTLNVAVFQELIDGINLLLTWKKSGRKFLENLQIKKNVNNQKWLQNKSVEILKKVKSKYIWLFNILQKLKKFREVISEKILVFKLWSEIISANQI